MNNKIKLIEKSTRTKISASQVILTIDSAIKELIENSIDAQSTNIEIVCQEGGISSITVKDNGVGISSDDAQLICLRYSTSKLTSFEDLTSVTSYGFRGEGLNSICSMSSIITLQTRLSDENVGREYSVSPEGIVLFVKLKAMPAGTSFIFNGLFNNLTVRRQVSLINQECR